MCCITVLLITKKKKKSLIPLADNKDEGAAEGTEQGGFLVSLLQANV